MPRSQYTDPRNPNEPNISDTVFHDGEKFRVVGREPQGENRGAALKIRSLKTGQLHRITRPVKRLAHRYWTT